MKDRFLIVLKLVCAVFLLPFVIGGTVAFVEQLRFLPDPLPGVFGAGAIAYLVCHILLYEPAKIFDSGKKMSEKAVQFFAPVVKVAGFCIPMWTVLCFGVYFFVRYFWPTLNALGFFVFLASLTFTMHLVFTVAALKSKQTDALKADYFFSCFFIYIINILILAGLFALLGEGFSFPLFCQRLAERAGLMVTAVLRQLFVVGKA